MTGQNQPIKISSLQSRYGLNSRQAVNNRINALFDRASLARGSISPEQLELLDKLDNHIRAGGAIADFPIQPEVQMDKLDKLDKPVVDIEFDQSGMSAINVMAGLMEKMMSYACAGHSSPLANYEELEKAARFEWVLPTYLVKKLIGVSPRRTEVDDTFIHGSFAFTRVGKIGRESGWQVTTKVKPKN